MTIETIFHLLISLVGLLLSAYALVWVACRAMVLWGCWPERDARRDARSALQGGCAKHDWKGARWP